MGRIGRLDPAGRQVPLALLWDFGEPASLVWEAGFLCFGVDLSWLFRQQRTRRVQNVNRLVAGQCGRSEEPCPYLLRKSGLERGKLGPDRTPS